MEIEKCRNCRGRVAWVGILVNLLLVVTKLVVGITSGSKACLADALHSTSNIITASAIWVTQRLTKKKADLSFNHGYGKAEFLAAGFVSFFILAAAILLISISIKHLLHEPASPPKLTAVLIAIISIVTNEMLFRYMRCVGSKFKSQTILANAWANRADSFSSMAVIVGVIGSRLGIPHLDPICAMIVVIVIVKISANILMDSIKSLMDVSVNDVYGDEIEEVSKKVGGVLDVSELKTRQIGSHIWAEINIHIEPLSKLKDGQAIADRVKQRLLDKIPDLENILIHVLPNGRQRKMVSGEATV
ncbi:Magnetosome protein MamM [Candidatus Desulfarcum epimagneticum]|uniref:Magnetosome protein MamM n=1 Tax=uncultured Desulfobacteraceae bacterium TaxID=218296 RepID=A0A484HFW3_9BACT|nr:Magnetosome protein MamM [uncultured Desulfobacteraceae bacterium]